MAISKVTLNGETLMDVTGDTVTENNMLYGIKATAANGNSVTGTVVTTPIDDTLDVSSSNAIQNQAVAIALSNKADTSAIPSATSDLSNNSYFVSDSNYTHTDNNYTTEEKTKLAGLSNYDDTEIKGDISSLQSTKADKTELSSKQDTITSNNKLSSDLVDDTNKTNKFVTSQEKTTWNNKSDFSGSYNDLTDKPTLFSGNYNDLSNKPTIPDELSDLSDDSTHRLVTDTEKSTWNSKSDFSGSYEDLTNKPTIPVVPTNVSSFTNDAGYITTETDPVFGNSASAGITSSDITNWNGKQEALVSGTNIKTINNTSLLGSGDITIGGSSVDVQINGTSIVSSNVANIVTNTAYDSSTNKIATMSDIASAIGTALNGNYQEVLRWQEQIILLTT